LYTVLAILERPDPPEPGQGQPPEPGLGQPPGARVPPPRRGARTPDEDDDGPAGPQRAAASGWQCWRVTASPAKNVPADTYRLWHDESADRWLLSRDSG
jgi:hypothetical protein